MPAVSIIIPTYNREGLLLASVDSVLNQSFRDIEVIVVDDGSTDNSLAVLASIKDERLRVIPIENRGRSKARNLALSEARGELIAFNDSDDVYLPGKLQMQVEYMNSHPEVAMIYTAATFIDGDGARIPGRYSATESGNIYSKIAFFVPLTITLPTVMVRADVVREVGAFDEQQSRFEDTDLWRRITRDFVVHGLDVATCDLRTHGDNVLTSQNPEGIISQIEYYVEKIKREDAPRGMRVRGGIRDLYRHYAYAFSTVRGWERHRDYLRDQSIYIRPMGRQLYFFYRYILPSSPRATAYSAKMHFLNFAYQRFSRVRSAIRSIVKSR